MCAVYVDAAGRHTSSTVNRWEIGRVENRISPQSVLFFFLAVMLHEVERFNFHHVAGCCRMDDGPFLFIIYFVSSACCCAVRTQLAATIWRGVDQLMTRKKKKPTRSSSAGLPLTYSKSIVCPQVEKISINSLWRCLLVCLGRIRSRCRTDAAAAARVFSICRPFWFRPSEISDMNFWIFWLGGFSTISLRLSHLNTFQTCRQLYGHAVATVRDSIKRLAAF